MRRRDFIRSIGATTIVLPTIAHSQQSQRPLIAYLSATSQTVTAPALASFLHGMRELGWVEGRNFEIVIRYTDGFQDRAPVQAQEVIALGPDIIFASGVISAVPARKLT